MTEYERRYYTDIRKIREAMEKIAVCAEKISDAIASPYHITTTAVDPVSHINTEGARNILSGDEGDDG